MQRLSFLLIYRAIVPMEAIVSSLTSLRTKEMPPPFRHSRFLAIASRLAVVSTAAIALYLSHGQLGWQIAVILLTALTLPLLFFRANTTDHAADVVRFAAIWDQSPLSMVLLDPHDKAGVVRIVDCNRTACEMHGRTRDEIVGQSINVL